MEFGKSLVAQTLSMEGDFHLWWIYPNPGVPLFMQQCKGQSQNLLCLRSSPLLTTVTQLHNLFQLRLPSKMQWYFQFKMIQNDHVGIFFSDSLPIRASKRQRTSINHCYPGGRDQATSDVSYGETGVLRSYAPHESCSFNDTSVEPMSPA